MVGPTGRVLPSPNVDRDTRKGDRTRLIGGFLTWARIGMWRRGLRVSLRLGWVGLVSVLCRYVQPDTRSNLFQQRSLFTRTLDLGVVWARWFRRRRKGCRPSHVREHGIV